MWTPGPTQELRSSSVSALVERGVGSPTTAFGEIVTPDEIVTRGPIHAPGPMVAPANTTASGSIYMFEEKSLALGGIVLSK